MYEKLIKVKSFGGKYLRKMKYCYCGGDKLKQEIKQNFDNLMKNTILIADCAKAMD